MSNKRQPTRLDYDAAAGACLLWDQANAHDPLYAFVARVMVAEREWSASVCDDVAGSASRTPVEKAVARTLAERIRSGRL